jgi:hypothetical protein
MLEPADHFPDHNASAVPLYYDPAVHLVANSIDNGVFHSAWMSADYAVALVENGSPREIERAEAVIGAVLDCQDIDPRSPHCGNFRWEHEDLAVEDLNAVQFVLLRLIPLLLNRADRLSETLAIRVRERIRLGLDAIRRIDVSPVYSNIVAQDIANAILGGQLLRLPEYNERGLSKLRTWLKVIDQSGIPHEYNSPTYSFVCIEALHKIVAFSDQPEAAALAQLIITRIGLSIALRIHPASGRLAPPHCRAYIPALVCQSPAEANALSQAIAQGKLPSWLATVLNQRPLPLLATETSDAGAGTVISSYLDAEYSIGVATSELATQSNRFISNQSNVFSIHYSRKHQAAPGVVFSRYLINDKWLGDYRSTPSRTSDHIFRDEGSFRGLLSGSRAIGMYTSPEVDAWSRVTSAKAALIWNDAEDVDEILVDGSRIKRLPAELSEGSVIVVGCAEVYIVIRPLDRAKLGAEAPVRIVEHRGSLVIEMYNYRGPAKTFWELGNPGAFFQGAVHNGFYAEVVAKRQYGSGRAVYEAHVAGYMREELDEPRTFDGANQRKWRISYSRDQRSLGIEIDLMRWRILRRWADDEALGFPMLTSPIARQDRSGEIALGNARLSCGNSPAWLLAIPEAELWVGAYHGPEAAEFTLALPDGQVRIEALERGAVVWDKGQVTIDAIGLRGAPEITGANEVKRIGRR